MPKNLINFFVARKPDKNEWHKTALELYKNAYFQAQHKNQNKIFGSDDIAQELTRLLGKQLKKFNLNNHTFFEKLFKNNDDWYPETLEPEQMYQCGAIQAALKQILIAFKESKEYKILEQLQSACTIYKQSLQQRKTQSDLKADHISTIEIDKKLTSVGTLINTLQDNTVSQPSLKLKQFHAAWNEQKPIIAHHSGVHEHSFITFVKNIFTQGFKTAYHAWRKEVAIADTLKNIDKHASEIDNSPSI